MSFLRDLRYASFLRCIRDLSDLNNDGRLTREGFAVAMHLIQGKMTGRDIPSTIPASLIPPSMRGTVTAAPPQPPVPEAIKDLLWDDSPPASATATTYPQSILQPQSTGTLSVLQPQSTGTLSTISQGRPTPTMSPPPRVPSAAVSDPFASSPFSIPQSASDIGCAPRTLLTNLRQPHPRRTCSETTTSRTLRPLLFRTSRRKSAMSRTSLIPQTGH